MRNDYLLEDINDGFLFESELLFGDFNFRILLFEICLKSWWFGERRVCFDGVELVGSNWCCEYKCLFGVEKDEYECMENGRFEGIDVFFGGFIVVIC